MTEQLALLYAAVIALAKESGHDDVIQYLSHASHNPAAFNDAVSKHLEHIKDPDAFEKAHKKSLYEGGGPAHERVGA